MRELVGAKNTIGRTAAVLKSPVKRPLPLPLAVDGSESTSLPGRFNPGKEPRHQLYRRLGGPQGRSGRFGKQKYFAPKIISRIEFPTFVQYKIIPLSAC